ncbi:hypothetical protein EJB05_36837, partial [Eragrostis curvula]
AKFTLLVNRDVHAFFDLYIVIVNGIERDEQEWKRISFEAGFRDYKIMPRLGFRSIIEDCATCQPKSSNISH